MKYFFFTHAADLDGMGCAVLAKLAFGVHNEIKYLNYNEVDKKVVEYLEIADEDSTLFITDISVNPQTADKIDASGARVILLDHHETALHLNSRSWAKVEINNKNGIMTCGTEMFYNYLVENNCFCSAVYSPAIARFVEIVGDRDTWRWAELGEKGLISKKMNDLFHIYGKERFVSWCFEQLQRGNVPQFTEGEERILEAKEKELSDYIKLKEEEMVNAEICGRPCAVVFAERFFSELGNRICTLHPEIDFIAIVNPGGFVSYRTIKDDVNVAKIAKHYGGGGHAKAAGSQFAKKVKKDMLRNLFQDIKF